MSHLLFLNPYADQVDVLDESHLLDVWDMFPQDSTLVSEQIRNAFLVVPRTWFVTADSSKNLYESQDVMINKSKIRIEDGVFIGEALNALGVEPGTRVLDIGTGTGFCTALLSFLTGEKGSVTTIDVDTCLLTAQENIKMLHHVPLSTIHFIPANCFDFVDADGFDYIFCIGASCPEEKLDTLLALAKPESVIIVRIDTPPNLTSSFQGVTQNLFTKNCQQN